MSTFFDQTELWKKIPSAVSNDIEELLHERIHSGVETTPDETSNLIESFYLFCARLWIAEALNIEQNHPDIFTESLGENILRFTYDFILSQRKEPTIGSYIFIARQIRLFFLQKNIAPFTKGLIDLDLGSSPQDETTTAKLLDFRNHFAHGAFHAEKEHVQEHYELLASCMEQVSGLYTQSFLVCEKGQWFQCNQKTSSLEGTAPDLGDGIYLFEDGKSIRLSGLFSFSEHVLSLVYLSLISSEEVFYSDVLKGFFERYIKEKNGDIHLEQEFSDTARVIPTQIKQRITEEIQKDNNACLIEAYPGSDVENILHHHEELGASFDAYFVWNIEDGDLTMSGYTFAYKIMRTIESIVADIPQIKNEPIVKKIERYVNLLEEKNKRIFILIHNLHIGLQTYQREKTILVDIYNMLLEKNISIIATIEPGKARNGIFYESIFQYPTTIHDREALEKRVGTLIKDPVKKQIIEAMCNQENMHLFEICDQIDSVYGEGYTFEPQIEYSLWEMSSILETKRIEKTIEEKTNLVRVWSLFDPSILEFVQ